MTSSNNEQHQMPKVLHIMHFVITVVVIFYISVFFYVLYLCLVCACHTTINTRQIISNIRMFCEETIFTV